jgi:hypothetical protein
MYRSRSLLTSASAKLGALATTGAVAFNGNQHAGIQVLNTAQFPVAAGPLSHVHR